ncbi:MAG: carbohydrate binding domain-containing protein [Polyangiaceae bacterium]
MGEVRAPFSPYLLLLSIACVAGACSDGQLDAFSRTELVGSGGAGGSSSGGASNGGSSGSSSTSPYLIDDFEDGDNQTLTSGGWWFVTSTNNSISANYGSASTRNGVSTRALRASGVGCNGWCFVGLDLPGPYLDARSFTRLSFWARAEASSVRMLSIDALDSTNINPSDSTAIHFRKDITLSTEWTFYSLSFDELVSTIGSPTSKLNRGTLSAIEFWVFSSDSFDFSLDDVSLVP